MKTSKLIGGCVLSLFLIGPTFAVSTVDFTPSGFGYLGAGGEVWARVLPGSISSIGIYGPGESFATYCVEQNEPLTYDVVFDAVVNPLGAVEGGYRGGNPDPVSDYTAWLYLEFVNGTLAPYEYEGTFDERNASAKALQWVLWGLEDELDAGFFGAGENGATGVNQGLGGLQQEFFTLAYNAVEDGWQNNDRVQAVNIFGKDDFGNTVHMQDILVVVPAPGAMGLVLFGIGMFGYLKRKRFFKY